MIDTTHRAAAEQAIIDRTVDRILSAGDDEHETYAHLRTTIADAISEACYDSVMIERRHVNPVLTEAFNAMEPIRNGYPVSQSEYAAILHAMFMISETFKGQPQATPQNSPPPANPAELEQLHQKIAQLEQQIGNLQLAETEQLRIIDTYHRQMDTQVKSMAKQDQQIADLTESIKSYQQNESRQYREIVRLQAQIENQNRVEADTMRRNNDLAIVIATMRENEQARCRQIDDLRRNIESYLNKLSDQESTIEAQQESIKDYHNYELHQHTMIEGLQAQARKDQSEIARLQARPGLGDAIGRLENLYTSQNEFAQMIANHTNPIIEMLTEWAKWANEQDSRRNSLLALGATHEQITAVYAEFHEKVCETMKAGHGLQNLLIIVNSGGINNGRK